MHMGKCGWENEDEKKYKKNGNKKNSSGSVKKLRREGLFIFVIFFILLKTVFSPFASSTFSVSKKEPIYNNERSLFQRKSNYQGIHRYFFDKDHEKHSYKK